jgi:uncharacterized protein
MIGTRVDDVDGPRLIRSKFGWWFIGNQTWTLLAADAVLHDGSLCGEAAEFLRGTRAFNPIEPRAYELTVLTSTDCNLGCAYCYQNKVLDSSGGHRPVRIDRNVLSPLTIKKIQRFAEKKMNEANLKDLFLVLFGGEPLLNAKGCRGLLQSLRSVGLKTASIVTNGVLLKPELAVALQTDGLANVQITLDGSRSDHNKIRLFRSGAATYDIILRNVARSMDITQLAWQFRVNVSHHNFQQIDLIFRELMDAGIVPSKCTMLFAWVGDKGLGYNNLLGFSKTVRDAFVEWSIAALKCGFLVPRPSMKRLCQTCSKAGGRHGAVVNSDGKLYSCWQSAGKVGFEVGDVENGFDTLTETRDRWVSCGYEFRQQNRGLFEDFHDEVDGRFLDYLHENGLLQ